MAVIMTFYNNFSKRINSTKRPTDGTDYEIVFKEGFSIYGGIVKLQVNFDTAKTYTAAKYGNYYYTVEDVVSLNNNLVEISVVLDALSTYKSSISSYESMIERCPSDERIVDVPDNTVVPLAVNTVNAFAANVYSIGVCFQLKTKNGNGDLAYFLDVTAFNSLLAGFEVAFWIEETQYIVSTKVLPINVTDCGGTQVSSVYIGAQPYPVSSGLCYAVKSATRVALAENNVDSSAITTTYTDEKRYNDKFVNLQCLINGQMIDLSSNYLRHNGFKIISWFDPLTCDVRLELFVKTANYDKLIISDNTNIGVGFMFVDIPNSMDSLVSAFGGISKTVTSTWNNLNETSGSIDKVMNNPDNYIKPGDAVYNKAYSMFAGYTAISVASMTANVLKDLYFAGLKTSTCGASSGSTLAAVMYGDVQFIVTEFTSTARNNLELGFPYYKFNSINNIGLTGFYKFVAPSLNIATTSKIKSALESYMSKGIFYE